MTSILPDRADLLDTVTFATGAHDANGDAMCVMECVSYITGEPWSDRPQCVSPVIAAFLRSWNDALPEPPRTALLRPLVPLVIGTRTTEADEHTRAWMATDWLVRVNAPAWMDLTPALAPHATALRRLPPLTSSEMATEFQSAIASAWDAASDAAAAAAADAAWYAAWDAAMAPIVSTLQLSAVELVKTMCAVGRDEQRA